MAEKDEKKDPWDRPLPAIKFNKKKWCPVHGAIFWSYMLLTNGVEICLQCLYETKYPLLEELNEAAKHSDDGSGLSEAEGKSGSGRDDDFTIGKRSN